MEKIIKYFTDEMEQYNFRKKKIEAEINSKKIISGEIKKTIERLNDSVNNTDNVFRANIINSEFNETEVSHLKNQQQEIQCDIETLNAQLAELENKIQLLAELTEYAKKLEIENQKEMPDDINTDNQKNNSIEEIVKELRNISNKLELAMKIQKMDTERSKMEVNLARVKLLFCIEKLSET
jgi:hypothetical protein